MGGVKSINGLIHSMRMCVHHAYCFIEDGKGAAPALPVFSAGTGAAAVEMTEGKGQFMWPHVMWCVCVCLHSSRD